MHHAITPQHCDIKQRAMPHYAAAIRREQPAQTAVRGSYGSLYICLRSSRISAETLLHLEAGSCASIVPFLLQKRSGILMLRALLAGGMLCSCTTLRPSA
jgi:hypothetical protein